MSQNNRDDKNNNNFFNQNPLVLFAIFSVIIILLFKSVIEPNEGMNNTNENSFGETQATKTQKINYYELKELIKN